MALELTVECTDGRLVDGAYWVPAQINIGAADKTGNLVFYGYASYEAKVAGKAPIAGAMRQYSFTKEQYEEATKITLGMLFPNGVTDENTLFEVLARFAYSIAMTRKDVAVLDEDKNPVLDENDEPVMKSFFEGAAHV